MLFNSFQYAGFLAGVVIAFWLLPIKIRSWLLLGASLYFYMSWRWEYVFLILFQGCLSYWAALVLERFTEVRTRRLVLISASSLGLGMLGLFKYYEFGRTTLVGLWPSAGGPGGLPVLDLILPVGISFYTFQTIGYTVDVYRRHIKAEPSLPRFLLFVSFFPQLVAGPIERASSLLPELQAKRRLCAENFVSGGKLILWGLFKKIVVADRLAEYVNRVYGEPNLHNGGTLLLATLFFAFQIYCDFSAYSDIAIGSARMLGIRLMRNFDNPYLAVCISDFWRRWHISLSTWFRDYVYYPMGGNRVGPMRWGFNIMAVFLISGLWHGANWTFIVWGMIHGLWFLVERGSGWVLIHTRLTKGIPLWTRNVAGGLVTFTVVMAGWVFFRAASVGDAWDILIKIVWGPWGPLYPGPSQLTTVLSTALIIVVMGVMSAERWGWIDTYFPGRRLPVAVRWSGYLALLLSLCLFGKSSQEFIYFQF